jgi:hypothetical protein
MQYIGEFGEQVLFIVIEIIRHCTSLFLNDLAVVHFEHAVLATLRIKIRRQFTPSAKNSGA